jgi:sulfatase maturation enzyme AslB (radical SAM superfamily)
MQRKFDIHPGYACNFRCKYCYETLGDKEYRNEKMSISTANKVGEYLNYLTENVFPKEAEICPTFYGGEPLLYTDVIDSVLDTWKQERGRLTIVTNGYLIGKNTTWFLELKKRVKNNLLVNISYDYSMQNEHRHKDTYESIYNNILWLHRNGINVRIITVFPLGDLPKFYETFNDFLKLKKQIKYLRFVFNIDRANISNTTLDEETVRGSLQKVRNYLEANNAWNYVNYNNGCGLRQDTEDTCFYGDVYEGVDVEGNIYPYANALFSSKYVQNVLCMGNINDGFASVVNNHNTLRNSLNYTLSEECINCTASCRVLPHRTIKTNISEYNRMPSEEHCKLHKMLAEYLKK